MQLKLTRPAEIDELFEELPQRNFRILVVDSLKRFPYRLNVWSVEYAVTVAIRHRACWYNRDRGAVLLLLLIRCHSIVRAH